MRIVSFWPAATAWLHAFGADVVAHDERLDPAALRALAPDLVVTHAAGPVTREVVARAWPDDTAPPIAAYAPTTMKAVLDVALALGRAAGRMPDAMRVLAAAEMRLQRLHDRLGLGRGADERAWPTVACIEGTGPLTAAGLWIPDLVRLAGGRPVLAEAGDPPRRLDPDALRAADPDVLCVVPVGPIDAAAVPGWSALRAVRTGRVHVFDGDPPFHRPGPRLYDAVEQLAVRLHGRA